VLIVNADDLGRTEGINAGIFEAHRRGLVTSATLMVGYPAAEEAAAQLDDHPQLGIGLHVALTGQAPLLPPEEVPSLVDSAGYFPKNPDGFGLLDLDPAQVLAEIRAQLHRFQHLTGHLPTHLDSHHHSHRHPIICQAVVTLAGEYKLPVRKSSKEVGERLHHAGIPTTEFFVEHFFGEQARQDVLLRILDEVPIGVTELMCHPAHVDDELRNTSSYAEERQRELEVLTHPDALLAMQRLNLVPARFDLLRTRSAVEETS
jgi:predicted glycoside hydrolase/deacetylase ChbG (UPF0249 family)